MLSTVVFISCAIIVLFQYTPETQGLIFCTLIFHFRKWGSGQFLTVFFFAYTLALQVFKLGFGLKTWGCTL